MTTEGASPVSRRDFAMLVALGTGLACIGKLGGKLGGKSGLAATAGQPAAVVGFHNDAPWLDLSGRDLPYLPRARVDTPMLDCESLMRLGHFL
jgi:hypothetical protein